MIRTCSACQKQVDVDLYSSAFCTKHKNDFCSGCCHQGKNCRVKGESCSLVYMANTQWVEKSEKIRQEIDEQRIKKAN
jgi:hypothetical protein